MINLTLEQLMLIKRIKAFSDSIFSDSLLDPQETTKLTYIVSDADWALFLTIPSSCLLSIRNIRVCTTFPERLKPALDLLNSALDRSPGSVTHGL